MNCKWFDIECEYVKQCKGFPKFNYLKFCPEYRNIDELITQGHTNHCACRIQWGDGECECKKSGEYSGKSLS